LKQALPDQQSASTTRQGKILMRLASEANIRKWPTLTAVPEAGGVAVKEQDAQLRIIVDELGHRMKNFVAIIQSIARQTMHQSTTKDDFEARFSGRLGALGRSLDLLTANDWRGARLDELVRLELTPFGALDAVRILVKGPSLSLNPEAARNIGLALHELATNATKYGALSVPGGKVAVRWEVTSSGGQSRFIMTWRESGGPLVTEPERWGFGRRVIQQITAQALTGRVTHEFLPSGVRWTLNIRASFVIPAGSEPRAR
jgi:two-component sensor histidine kinase